MKPAHLCNDGGARGASWRRPVLIAAGQAAAFIVLSILLGADLASDLDKRPHQAHVVLDVAGLAFSVAGLVVTCRMLVRALERSPGPPMPDARAPAQRPFDGEPSGHPAGPRPRGPRRVSTMRRTRDRRPYD